MDISFAWTAEAFVQGRKTCTRRLWKERHLKAWQRAWDNGRWHHRAVNKQRRFGGQQIGVIELTERPYRERLADMPEEDLQAEGGLWASKAEFIKLFGGPDLEPVVIRFRRIDAGWTGAVPAEPHKLIHGSSNLPPATCPQYEMPLRTIGHGRIVVGQNKAPDREVVDDDPDSVTGAA